MCLTPIFNVGRDHAQPLASAIDDILQGIVSLDNDPTLQADMGSADDLTLQTTLTNTNFGTSNPNKKKKDNIHPSHIRNETIRGAGGSKCTKGCVDG